MPRVEGDKVVFYFNSYSKDNSIKGTTDLWAVAKDHTVTINVIFDSKPWDVLAMAVYDDNGEAVASSEIGAGAFGKKGKSGRQYSDGRWCETTLAFGLGLQEGKRYRVLIGNGRLPSNLSKVLGVKEKQHNNSSATKDSNYPTYYFKGVVYVVTKRATFTLSIQQTGGTRSRRYQGDVTFDGESPVHLDGKLGWDDNNRLILVMKSEYGDDTFTLLLNDGVDLSKYSTIPCLYSTSVGSYSSTLQQTSGNLISNNSGKGRKNVGSEFIGIDEVRSHNQNNKVGGVKGWTAERVARSFCEAMYDNNMVKAKSYMNPEDARRTPDTIRGYSKEELDSFKRKLKRAKYKVIESEYTDKVVTVKFYDPDFPYLDKKGRWFGCALTLSYSNDGWKVVSYGY